MTISPLPQFTSLNKNHNEKCNQRANNLPDAHRTMQILNPPPSICTATPLASPFANPLSCHRSPTHTAPDICPPSRPAPPHLPAILPLSILEGRSPFTPSPPAEAAALAPPAAMPAGGHTRHPAAGARPSAPRGQPSRPRGRSPRPRHVTRRPEGARGGDARAAASAAPGA